MTFQILKKIRKDHLQTVTLDPNFIWNDYLFPYSEDQLSKDENGNLDYASDFIKEQDRFLSQNVNLPEIIQSLERHSNEDLPPHINAKNITEVYQVGKRLGNGRYGEVHEVQLQGLESQANNTSSDKVAMKRIRKPAPREGASGLARSTVSEFETELHNLRRCSSHQHIVHLQASFTDYAHFGFVVSPVAADTLQNLLREHASVNHIEEDGALEKALFKSFGCLLSAVDYLHQELQVRHRDIKPRNILMHEHRVVICDLGSAYDFEDRKESTDNRRPPGTQKYKAPEVLESINSSEPRKHNTKVDVFSLGCVFLEIHTVLCGRRLDEMARSITQTETTEWVDGDWTYASSLEHAHEWLNGLLESDGPGEGLNSLIRSMVRLECT